MLPRPTTEMMRSKRTNAIVRRVAGTGGNAPWRRAGRPRWGVGLIITMRLSGVLPLCLIVFAAMLFGPDAMAQQHRELRVAVSSAQLVEFPRPARSVFIADPAIADVQVPSPTSVIVFGRKPGQTTLIAIGEDDKPVATMQVIVAYEFADLRRLIQQEVPNADIKISPTANGTGVILTGVVPDDDMAEKVRAAAHRFATDKDTVINRVQVAGPNQVNLRLRVAEVSRSVTKQLGFNWEAVMSAGSFTFGLATGRLGGRRFLARLGWSFVSRFGRSFFSRFRRGFGAVLLLLFDHLGLGRASRSGGFGRLLGFGHRSRDGYDGNLFVPENLHAFRGFDISQMNGLANFKMRHIDLDHFRQIFWQRARFDPEQNVFQDPAARLDPGRFTFGFNRDHDGHFLVFSDFMEVHMEEGAAQSMMLHLLDEGQPFGAGIAGNIQIDQNIFRSRMVDEVFEVAERNLELLGSVMAAIDHSRNAAAMAQFLGTAPSAEGARIRCQ